VSTSQISLILDDLAAALESLGRTVRVATWRVSLIDGDLPVFLIRPQERLSEQQHSSPNRPTVSRLRVAILAADGGRTAGDEDWGAQRQEELELLVEAAVSADPTRGGYAMDTVHKATTYAPETGSSQVDASVVLEFEIIHRVRFGDLSSNSP
jgi:hypothetical protein